MTKEDKIRQIKKQHKEMLKKCLVDLNNASVKLLNSGAINTDDAVLMDDNYMLAKLIIIAYFDDKPYMIAGNIFFQKELKNIKYFI